MSQVAEKIAKEIEGCGAIPFSRFMELALYCPVCGYYEKEEDTIGRGGDYYTSVSAGRLFGELLGFQFAEWTDGGGPGGPQIEVVEAGAHRGDLARDILGWMRQRRPGIYARLTYWIVEPSGRRREWQHQTLAAFAGRVLWAGGLGELPAQAKAGGVEQGREVKPGAVGARRIIFANELLDALPVHRLGWDAKARIWFEWGVRVEQGRFVWTRLPGDATALAQGAFPATLSPQLADALPDGFVVEVCPAAHEWWRAAADALGPGKLLTFDYGLTADELLAPERKRGTLRAYRRHQLSDDVLADPGMQDITAHVNFSALQVAGEAAGLRTEAFQSQEQFLTHVAGKAWQEGSSFGEWTARSTRQFQTLTHPEHLGRAFRVLVQAR
ncbi:MAG TPA: SAM-dependent methyltransferase [Candidatus Acidoferrum sp.]|nr:SAM-dependent methyltransferase [Candidatus Acidoferrum sp.]